MNDIDERAQQEAEESRMMESLAVLQRVRNSVILGTVSLNGRSPERYATIRDVEFLAAEMGLSTQYKEMK